MSLRLAGAITLLLAGFFGAPHTSFAQIESSDSAAQDSAAASTNDAARSVEEIVVTARKREERLQDVPVSVDVFSGVDIEAKSFRDMRDLAQFSPNLTFVNSPARGSGAVFIRGVGQIETDVTSEAAVGIYQDGVYIAHMQGFDLELMDVDRVEVLRGPQGTLFGKNTSGGAVNFVSARPTDEFEGSAEITAGRFDRRDGKLSLNVPLIPGKLAGRFAAATRNQDGHGKRLDFATGETVDEAGDTESLSGRALFNWTPSEAVDVLLSVDGRRVRNGLDVTRLGATNDQAPLIIIANTVLEPEFGDIFLTDDEYTSFATGPDGWAVDAWNTALTATWNLDALNIKSITGYRDLEVVSRRDVDGTPFRLLEQEATFIQDQFSQELQFSGVSFNGRLTWLGGLYYLQSNADVTQDTIILEPVFQAIGLDLSGAPGTIVEKESYAVFGNLTHALTDRLNVTGGLRWNRDTSEALGKLDITPLSGAIRSPASTTPATFEGSGLKTWQAGVDYHWTDEVMTHFSVSRGYKAGLPASPSVPAVDPEFVLGYELGVKSEFLDRHLRFNAAAFYSDYTDLQFLVRRFDPDSGQVISFTANAGKAEIKGFEAQLDAQPVDRLTLGLGLGHVDAEYIKLDEGVVVTTDTEFVATPKWTVTASGQYSMPLADWGTITGRLDYAYKTAIEYDTVNDPIGHQDPYGLLNARLTFEDSKGNWLLAVFGTNLTDERYLLSGASLLSSLGLASQQYGRPREWGVSLRYSF